MACCLPVRKRRHSYTERPVFSPPFPTHKHQIYKRKSDISSPRKRGEKCAEGHGTLQRTVTDLGAREAAARSGRHTRGCPTWTSLHLNKTAVRDVAAPCRGAPGCASPGFALPLPVRVQQAAVCHVLWLSPWKKHSWPGRGWRSRNLDDFIGALPKQR